MSHHFMSCLCLTQSSWLPGLRAECWSCVWMPVCVRRVMVHVLGMGFCAVLCCAVLEPGVEELQHGTELVTAILAFTEIRQITKGS